MSEGNWAFFFAQVDSYECNQNEILAQMLHSKICSGTKLSPPLPFPAKPHHCPIPSLDCPPPHPNLVPVYQRASSIPALKIP